MLKINKLYFLIIGILLLVLSLPEKNAEGMRSYASEIFTPLWNGVTPKKMVDSQQELQKLQIENVLLMREINYLKTRLEHEMQWRNDLKKMAHAQEMTSSYEKKLELSLHALPAQVIYREPSTWYSSLWLNVGKLDNVYSGKEIVAKNSPVVFGQGIVGVVDYVADKQSRVRLITDSNLVPSVRAYRGDPQHDFLLEYYRYFKHNLTFFCYGGVHQNKERLFDLLSMLEKELKKMKVSKNYVLAKGEIHGSSSPLWRGSGMKLKGIGFNYDFNDDEGVARELRSGLPLTDLTEEPISLLQMNDLLVTTGMDGVFPPGLHVGIVTKVEPLKEGDYYYELEARAAVGNLDTITTVYVMPPYN